MLGEFWQISGDTGIASDLATVNFENDFLIPFVKNELSPQLFEILRKATTLNMKSRYRSVSELKKDFSKFLSRGEKIGATGKPQNQIKKNIGISYKRIFSDQPSGERTELDDLIYTGQKRITLGTADKVRIRFTDIQLKKAKFTEPSFLKCAMDKNDILISVDVDDIQKKIQPLIPAKNPSAANKLMEKIRGKGKEQQKPYRIEFDCTSFLMVEGILNKGR
jgi:hypothetical protein